MLSINNLRIYIKEHCIQLTFFAYNHLSADQRQEQYHRKIKNIKNILNWFTIIFTKADLTPIKKYTQ